MAVTHTQATEPERIEFIAFNIGEVQMDRKLLSHMIWSQLGRCAQLPMSRDLPGVNMILRLLVDDGKAIIREYTEADLDETGLLFHIQIRPYKRSLAWKVFSTLVQEIDGVHATAVGSPVPWRHVKCAYPGGYASTLVDVLLTDAGLKEMEEALLSELRANALKHLATEVFTHTDGEFPHATLAPLLYQVQEVAGLREWTRAIARDIEDEDRLSRSISLSLTETGLVARPEAIGLSGQVWVKAKLIDGDPLNKLSNPHVGVTVACFYERNCISNRVYEVTGLPKGQLATRLEALVLQVLQEQGKRQLTSMGLLPGCP